MASHIFVKTTSLSGLNYNFAGHKNLKLSMSSCRKKVISTSSFLLASFRLIFLKTKPPSRDFSILAKYKL
jgi:hypothetical protein